jgi:hypothetical protein
MWWPTVRVAFRVVATQFLSKMEGPVGVEVAAGTEGAKAQDGFGAVSPLQAA